MDRVRDLIGWGMYALTAMALLGILTGAKGSGGK